MNLTKDEVMRHIEDWYHENEATTVTPPHPLVSVQEGHLTDTGTGGMTGTQKRQGRSKPPIRDMSGTCRRVDRLMSHVKQVNPKYYHTMIAYVLMGNLDDAAEVTRQSKTEAFKSLHEGLVAFKSGWLLI